MTIKPEPLTAEAFAPFGQVLAATGAEPQRKAFAANMHNARPGAKPNMTYMKVAPQPGLVRIDALERHPYSNQTFVPLEGTRHLVAVCPSDPGGNPVLSELRVFVADGSQAVNYDANVWHAPRTALCAPGEFVMFRWDAGTEQDTELIELEMSLVVAPQTLPPRPSVDMPRRLIVAISSDAIDPARGTGTPEAQKAIAAETARAMLPLLQLDNQLVITHGNGPQVGKLLLANAIARERITPQSLDILVAQTQGATAYILSQAFENALREVGSSRHVVGLVTQVEVDPEDPAFRNPTKPVGPFFTKSEAQALAEELGVSVREDSGRGWRYVVPSPRPMHICDISLVEALMCLRTVVVAGGGGGIPVVRDEQGRRRGVEAVIDKDLTTAAMANVLGIRDMMILTAVPRVAIRFGQPDQQDLSRVSLSEIRRHQAQGHFPAGSMGPKVEAAIHFLEGGGRRAIITNLEDAVPALRGETGTHIVHDNDLDSAASSIRERRNAART